MELGKAQEGLSMEMELAEEERLAAQESRDSRQKLLDAQAAIVQAKEAEAR